MTDESTQTTPLFYSIIDYTVDGPETQHELAEAFAALQKRWVRFYPGYHSARLLASTDGTRLYNVIAWRDEDSFVAFERESDTEGRIAAVQAAVDGVGGRAEARMTGAPRYRLLASVAPGPRNSSAEHEDRA